MFVPLAITVMLYVVPAVRASDALARNVNEPAFFSYIKNVVALMPAIQ